MSKTPGVSIIIVNWNGKKWLKKLLDSVTNQTYKNYEILFVDNKSTDDSISYVKANYPNVNVIENDRNAGFATGNNFGMKYAKNPLIMLLNTDTWISKGFVESLVNEKLDRDLEVIAPQEADYITKKTRKPYVTLIDLFGHPIFLKKSVRKSKSFYLSGVCLLFSKEMYQITGGLDNNFFMYCEEVDWFWRLLLFGIIFDYSEKVFVYHAGGGSSAKGLNARIFLWRNENTLRMLLKNYSTLSLVLILPIFFILGFLEMLVFYIILKPKIANSYIRGWIKIFKERRSVFKSRKIIQSSRKYNDLEIIKNMYFGVAKAHHMATYIKHNLIT